MPSESLINTKNTTFALAHAETVAVGLQLGFSLRTSESITVPFTLRSLISM